ncbi:hypothetical protein HK100_002859, partial [Physocladia obscura]
MTISSDRPLSMTYILAPPQPQPPSPRFKIPLAPVPRPPPPRPPSPSSPRSPRKSHHHRLALSAFPHSDHEQQHQHQQPERGFLLRRTAVAVAPAQQQSPPPVSARHHRNRMNCLKNCHRPSRADLLLPPQQVQQQAVTLPQQPQLQPAVLPASSPLTLAPCVVSSLRPRNVKCDAVVPLPLPLASAPVSLLHMVT